MVRRPGFGSFDGQATATLAKGLCNCFLDTVKLVNSKIYEGLRSFQVDITPYTYISPPSVLSTLPPVTPDELEKFIQSAQSKTCMGWPVVNFDICHRIASLLKNCTRDLDLLLKDTNLKPNMSETVRAGAKCM